MKFGKVVSAKFENPHSKLLLVVSDNAFFFFRRVGLRL